MKTMARLLATTAILATLATAAHSKTLVYCSEGSPEGFDPALYTAGTTFNASSRPIYNRLVEFERGTTKVIPGLAESWEVAEDGMEYTFKLRPGVKFHTTEFFTPTRDLNADDVIFTYERQLKPDHPWGKYVEGTQWDYFNSMEMGTLIKEIVKVDDLTVKFVLNRPEAPFIANIAMDFASVMSKEYADKLQADGKMADRTTRRSAPARSSSSRTRRTRHPLQVEPRLLERQAADRRPRFRHHHGQFRAHAEAESGRVPCSAVPEPGGTGRPKADPNLQVMEQDGLNVGYLAYNTQQKPFDDVRVRKALNMAINKQAIMDAVFQGAGQPAKNPIPPTMWSYNDAMIDDPYDPEAAKKLLAEAGVSGLKMKVWAMPVARPYNPNAKRMAELIQADFAAVGVDVEIVSYEWGEYLKISRDVNRDGAVLLGWTGDNGDPDNFLAVLLGCGAVGNNNRAQWCNQAFEDLIQKAKVTADQAERTKLYEEAQVVFKQEAPWATIAHSVVFMPMSKKVTGYKMDPLGSHRFDGVDITE